MSWIKRNLGLLLFSATACFPLGSFLTGVLWCSTCNSRQAVFMGFGTMVMAFFTGGFLPANAANVGPRLNIWPNIVLTAIGLVVLGKILAHLLKVGPHNDHDS